MASETSTVNNTEETKEKEFTRSESTISSDGNCNLCWEKCDIFAIGPCDHPICYKCSARMRVLSKELYCPSCRAEMNQVVFSEELHNFKHFMLNKLQGNRKYGIRFKNKNMVRELDLLLTNTCTVCDNETFGSFKELKIHVRRVHEKQFCDICIANVSLFPLEMKTYTKKELVQHRKVGDAEEKSYRGHPECVFCFERFFDNDSLLLHLRKNHFWCHFCEHDGHQYYFNVYDDLREHFSAQHILCEEGQCINEKYTSVFRSEIDLQAHKLAQHGKNLSKIQAKEARKIHIDYKYERPKPRHGHVTLADYEDVQKHNKKHRTGRSTTRHITYNDFEDVEKERQLVEERRKERLKDKPNEETQRNVHESAVKMMERADNRDQQCLDETDATPTAQDFPTLPGTTVAVVPVVTSRKQAHQEAFPPLLATTKAVPGTRKQKHLNKSAWSEGKQTDDFPTLSTKTYKPSETATVKIKRDPPGFKDNSSEATLKKPPGLEKPKAPPGLHTPPPGERNTRLLRMLHTVLGDESNFNLFKKLSGEFRHDVLSSVEYYSAISELLGDNLKVVFSELVALLPDEQKKEALLALYNNAKVLDKQRNYKSGWNRPSTKHNIPESKCPECSAIIPKGQLDIHMESHSESFPALPVSTTRKKNYSFLPLRMNAPVRSAWGK